MNEASYPLNKIYEGWETYQTSLIDALKDLSPGQLTWRAAPELRTVGQIAAHICVGRISWFHRMDAPGSAEILAEVEKVASEDAIADSAAEIVHWLNASWQIVEKTLASWTVADLAETYEQPFQGKVYAASRQWTIWRILAHDLHHGGEIAVMLGLQGVPIPELGDFGGHLNMPTLVGSQ